MEYYLFKLNKNVFKRIKIKYNNKWYFIERIDITKEKSEMTEIVIIMLAAVIIVLYLLFKFGIIKRRVIVTIVQNLPIGIFRDKNKNYQIVNKVYVKEISKNKVEDEADSKEENDKLAADSLGDHKDKSSRGSISEEINISDSTDDMDHKDIINNKIVYWTPKGKTYHNSKSCFALSRSRVINEGTVEESEKSALCDLCRDNL